MEFDRTPVPLLNPYKDFTAEGEPLGYTAMDFWRFQFSNVWDMQEEVAEFLVAKALGLELPHNKNGWTPYDINYQGKRIEIKATAYYHSWRGDGKVSKQRNFGIAASVGQHNERKPNRERQNDIYVFCLNTGETKKDSDPFELSHWEFYVVPTADINRLFDNKKAHISLNQVRRITNQPNGISYQQLKDTIDSAVRKI